MFLILGLGVNSDICDLLKVFARYLGSFHSGICLLSFPSVEVSRIKKFNLEGDTLQSLGSSYYHVQGDVAQYYDFHCVPNRWKVSLFNKRSEEEQEVVQCE